MLAFVLEGSIIASLAKKIGSGYLMSYGKTIDESEIVGISTEYWNELRIQREKKAKTSLLGQYSTIAFSIQNTVLFLQSILVACATLGLIVIPYLYPIIVIVSFLQAVMLLITNYRSYTKLFADLRGEAANFFLKFANKFKRLKDLYHADKDERWEIIGDIFKELLAINVTLYKTLGSAFATWQFLDNHSDTTSSLASRFTNGKIQDGGKAISIFLVGISTPGVAVAQYSLFSRNNSRKNTYKEQRLLNDINDSTYLKQDESSKFSFRLVMCHFFALSYGILDALLYSEALFRAAVAHNLFNASTPYLSPLFWVLIAETGVLFYGNYSSYLGLMKNYFFSTETPDNAKKIELSKSEKFERGFNHFININSAVFKTIGSALSSFFAIARYMSGSLPLMIVFGILVAIASMGVLVSNLALFAYQPQRKNRITHLMADTADVEMESTELESGVSEPVKALNNADYDVEESEDPGYDEESWGASLRTG